MQARKPKKAKCGSAKEAKCGQVTNERTNEAKLAEYAWWEKVRQREDEGLVGLWKRARWTGWTEEEERVLTESMCCRIKS
jgi:hypothetical protein